MDTFILLYENKMIITKTALVTPLIEKANLPPDDLKNYHPVSGPSFILKLVEHVVAKQLLEHIHIHNLDNPLPVSI